MSDHEPIWRFKLDAQLSEIFSSWVTSYALPIASLIERAQESNPFDGMSARISSSEMDDVPWLKLLFPAALDDPSANEEFYQLTALDQLLERLTHAKVVLDAIDRGPNDTLIFYRNEAESWLVTLGGVRLMFVGMASGGDRRVEIDDDSELGAAASCVGYVSENILQALE